MNVSNGKALSDAANLLNAISGGDGITVERKFKDDYNCVLPLHITLAGNRLPNFGSHTEAMLRRLLVVPFDVTFQDNADRDLAKKLAEDLSAILNWALVGLDRVQLHGDFSEPQESKNAKARLRHIGDDTQIFLAERCTIERDAVTDKDPFYMDYVEWCEGARVTALPKNTFAERLREINPNIRPSRRRTANGKQVPVYRGIRLSDEWLGKRYRLDENLIAMGYPAADAVLCNSRGEPIRLGAQNDFD